MARKRFLSVAVVAISCFFVLSLSFSTVAAGESPSQVHLTWSSDDTAHTMTVTWWTSTANSGDEVLYDTQPWGGEVDQYSHSATGSHHTFSGFEGYVHDAELTGLSSDTTYYFVCGGENGGYSQEWSFRTAPISPESCNFVAGGDSRPPYEGETHPTDFPKGRDALSKEMASREPEFAIYTGDFVLDSASGEQWDNWFNAMQKYWVTSENRMIPIIPSIGNHEITYPQPPRYDPENDAPYYYEQFALPGNERWYSLDWGPEIHIVVLDSEIQDTGSEAWEEQKSWLRSDLSEHEDFRWKIVTFHTPPFSSDLEHGSDVQIREEWAGIFTEYGVDLVINGHAHDYERTEPLRYSGGNVEVEDSAENATVYVISGGWGAPVYEVGSHEWTAEAKRERHILNFAVSPTDNELSMEAVDTSGETFDSFTLPFGSEPPAFPTIPPYLYIIVGGAIIFALASYYIRGRSSEGEYEYA